MIQFLKSVFRPHALNHRGWSTRERLLVLHSDDWGSLRSAGPPALDALAALGVRVDTCPYMRFDTLASDQDLERLFDVLTSVKDRDGRPAILTANTLMATPDFDAIRDSGFQTYASLTLEQTFDRQHARTGRHPRGLALWREGIAAGVFAPQLHGMEHVNVPRWMRALRSGNPVLRTAFEHGMSGVTRGTTPHITRSLQAALHADSPEDRTFILERLTLALQEFRRHFGHASRTFIPPNYTHFPEIEPLLASSGVRHLQTASVQRLLRPDGTVLTRRTYTGDPTPAGLRCQARNVHFEPSENPSADWVAHGLRDIQAAFRWNRPAIVSTHRVNFVGAFDSAHRDRNLALLRELLTRALHRWPDLRFLHAAGLGALIESGTRSFPALATPAPSP